MHRCNASQKWSDLGKMHRLQLSYEYVIECITKHYRDPNFISTLFHFLTTYQRKEKPRALSLKTETKSVSSLPSTPCMCFLPKIQQ